MRRLYVPLQHAGRMIALTLPVPPSANRWWRRHGNIVHLSNEARKYCDDISTRLRAAHVVMIRPPRHVRVSVVWFRGRKSGDLDKRLGILLDALQAQAYENDAQIVELHAKRIEDPENPRVEVEVSAV